MDKLAADATWRARCSTAPCRAQTRSARSSAAARRLYDRQDFNASSVPGATTASSRSTPPRFAADRSGLHLVTFNADGQAQHIAAHYRPLSSLMLVSRLLRETFAGTPYADHFLVGEA